MFQLVSHGLIPSFATPVPQKEKGAGHPVGGPTPCVSLCRRSACALGGLLQVLRPRSLPLRLALGPLLLGAHLLGFACLLQRAPLVRTPLPHPAALHAHHP